MAAIKYQHSLVRPSELLSSCGWMMLFVDQPSGGRVPGFRRISQINGFSTLLPGSEKKMLTTHGCFVQKQQLIGNAYGEVLLQRAEKIFGNDTWQLCYPTSPFHFSLEFSLGFPASGVTVKVQGINSKSPVISPYSWPAFLAMCKFRRLKTSSQSCKILILWTVLAHLLLGYFLNHLDNVVLPFCIFS